MRLLATIFTVLVLLVATPALALMVIVAGLLGMRHRPGNLLDHAPKWWAQSLLWASGVRVRLHGPETLRLDDHVRFRLHLEHEAAPVKGRARVVRCAADGQRAIVFEEISRQDRERLIHFIFDRQREARARTRGTDSQEQGGENE
jgi:hypothetical protein